MTTASGRCARCDGVLEAQDLFCGDCGAPRRAAAVGESTATEASQSGSSGPVTGPGKESPPWSGRRVLMVVFLTLATVVLANAVWGADVLEVLVTLGVIVLGVRFLPVFWQRVRSRS